MSVGIFNEIPLALLLLVLELFPLPSPLPKDPRVGMLCLTNGFDCCCSGDNSPAVVVCCLVPLPESITIFEEPVDADSPVDCSRGLVSWVRREAEAVDVVCFRGRRNVADRVTWGLLSDDCKRTRNLE